MVMTDFFILQVVYSKLSLFMNSDAVEVDQGKLGTALINCQDALEVNRGSTVEDGRVDLGVGETGISAAPDLNLLVPHEEILAH